MPHGAAVLLVDYEKSRRGGEALSGQWKTRINNKTGVR
jgi:hypothetical protein